VILSPVRRWLLFGRQCPSSGYWILVVVGGADGVLIVCALEGTRLTAEEKAKFLNWTRLNVERHWSDREGPIMTSDVIVIDDPQGAQGGG
jgi:hypothetical protein